ncbi:hypothetical protein EP7_003637 [Isosphaeraceae bacterium EP7]
MKFDDDPLLSAFLDGELSPADRGAFDPSMAADPALVEFLNDLTRVRDAVASLPRPGMPRVDLAWDVLSELQTTRRRRVWSPLRVSLMASGLAAAAAIWLAFANPLHVPPRFPRNPAIENRPNLVQHGPETLRGEPVLANAGPSSAILPVLNSARPANDLDLETERVQVRHWLDGQDIRQLVVKASPATQPSDLIVEILRTTARKDPTFAHLGETRLPGSEADDDSFAVVLRPCELGHLHDLIRKAFPAGKVGEIESIAGGPTLYPLGDAAGLQLVAGTPLNPVQHPQQADRPILASSNQGNNLVELDSEKNPAPEFAESTPHAAVKSLDPKQPLTLLLRIRKP